MKKKLLLTCLITFCELFIFCNFTSAQNVYRRKPMFADAALTGFAEYPPFGYVKKKSFHTVFRPMINDLIKEKKLLLDSEKTNPNLEKITNAVRQGNLDIFLGAYHETEIFGGIELIYPAVLTNPITIFMLPARINDVKNINDLQKLKGARHASEYFSDFVEEKLQAFNVEKVNTSYELFEKLFTHQIDYIVASQYFGLIEASKLGLRGQISVAKQALWQIPMFIGISQLSRHRQALHNIFTEYLRNPENIEKIRKNVIDLVNQAEADAIGIVPPDFEKTVK
ncbi:MAG: hypothetical protein E7012_02530 [Alphaproteobacteria bacterium]|nr:hypothetical protein [Alphaproteobacteria bacterium]